MIWIISYFSFNLCFFVLTMIAYNTRDLEQIDHFSTHIENPISSFMIYMLFGFPLAIYYLFKYPKIKH